MKKRYKKTNCIEKNKTYYADVVDGYKELEDSELLYFLRNDNLYLEDFKNYHAHNCGTRNPYPDADHSCTCGEE